MVHRRLQLQLLTEFLREDGLPLPVRRLEGVPMPCRDIGVVESKQIPPSSANRFLSYCVADVARSIDAAAR
jgi:hypothetical protein